PIAVPEIKSYSYPSERPTGSTPMTTGSLPSPPTEINYHIHNRCTAEDYADAGDHPCSSPFDPPDHRSIPPFPHPDYAAPVSDSVPCPGSGSSSCAWAPGPEPGWTAGPPPACRCASRGPRASRPRPGGPSWSDPPPHHNNTGSPPACPPGPLPEAAPEAPRSH